MERTSAIEILEKLALAALEKGVGVSVSVSDYEQSEGGGLRGAMLLNVAERAANARPGGVWIEEKDADWCGGGCWRCSACGYGYSFGMQSYEDLNYCPHCGERMEGATWTDGTKGEE